MIYIDVKEKENDIKAYNVSVDTMKLNELLNFVDSVSILKIKNKKYNSVLNLGNLIRGIINGNENSLYLLLNNNKFSKYDNIIKKTKKDYKDTENIIINNLDPERLNENLEKLILLGERLVKIEKIKYYDETLYRIFYTQVLSSLYFEEIKLDKNSIKEYKKRNK